MLILNQEIKESLLQQIISLFWHLFPLAPLCLSLLLSFAVSLCHSVAPSLQLTLSPLSPFISHSFLLFLLFFFSLSRLSLSLFLFLTLSLSRAPFHIPSHSLPWTHFLSSSLSPAPPSSLRLLVYLSFCHTHALTWSDSLHLLSLYFLSLSWAPSPTLHQVTSWYNQQRAVASTYEQMHVILQRRSSNDHCSPCSVP